MASIEDNVGANDIYTIDQNNQDINRALTSRIDPAFPNYINVAPVPAIQPSAPNFPVNTNYGSAQGFQSIYPRLQVQSETAEDEPIYVNAKQYNRIILRRKARAKWEAEHRVTKKEKPYMHESRHEHAMRRIRGADGRFLKKEEIEAMVKRGELKLSTSENQPQSTINPITQNNLPIPFSGIPLSVVDPRMTGIMSAGMTMEQNPELPVSDQTFHYYKPDGHESAL